MRHGYTIEELHVGMSEQFGKTITDADIVLFAGISGDTNPVHLNAEFAATTPFKQRIAHGMLTASFISTVLGTRLPGQGAIYVSQQVKFKAPVFIGDTIIATVTVKEINVPRNRVTLETLCHVGDKLVVEGEAVLMPAKSATSA